MLTWSSVPSNNEISRMYVYILKEHQKKKFLSPDALPSSSFLGPSSLPHPRTPANPKRDYSRAIHKEFVWTKLEKEIIGHASTFWGGESVMVNKILDAKRLKCRETPVFSEDSSTMDSLITYVSVLSFCFGYICYCLVLWRLLCCLVKLLIVAAWAGRLRGSCIHVNVSRKS